MNSKAIVSGVLVLTLVGAGWFFRDELFASDDRSYTSAHGPVRVLTLEPDKASKSSFHAAPPELREFLRASEAAQQIQDPLQRCLATPDLPGNRWPEGSSTQYCQFLYEPHISLVQVKDLLARGDLPELDRRFAVDLQRHFSDTEFSEVIHADFYDFDGGAESDAVSQQWLQLAPKSPYALVARGMHLRDAAITARGDAWASDTAPEDMQRMHQLAEQAIPLFRQALALEPRLLPAHSGLIRLGYMTSQGDVAREGWYAAEKIDPACRLTANNVMTALTPRWGGSVEAMRAFAHELTKQAPRRPLLWTLVLQPDDEAGETVLRQDRFPEAMAMLKPVVSKGISPNALVHLAGATTGSTRGDSWISLVYLIEARRFGDESHNGDWNRGVLLLQVARKPAWALEYFERSIKAHPDDAEAYFLLGQTYSELDRYDESERVLLVAMKDEKQRPFAWNARIENRIKTKQWDWARKEVDQLNEKYPHYAIGWYSRFRVLSAQKDPEAEPALRNFIKYTDRGNPAMRRLAERYERVLAGKP